MIHSIYLDFDGVIVDTVKAIVELYNEDFQYYKKFRQISPEEINTWNFKECTCASEKYINTYFNTPRFFNKLEFMIGAETIIDLLVKQFDVYIVSHGYSPNLKIKEKWIAKNLPKEIQFIGINLKNSNDKSCVDMSDGIFVDDKLVNVNSTNAQFKILFGREYSWNIDDTEGEKDYVRCIDWVRTYEEILKKTGGI